jgi:hypothetical protein
MFEAMMMNNTHSMIDTEGEIDEDDGGMKADNELELEQI